MFIKERIVLFIILLDNCNILQKNIVIKLLSQIFQVVTFENNVMEFLFPFVFVGFNIAYMFFANIMGQYVTDHNRHVFVTA